MRLAIIGSGISGLTVAHYLHPQHDITLFEASPTLGGHTNTIEVPTPNGLLGIDTGFIVCNDRTYPNFLKLLAELGIAPQPSDMSFSVHCERTGLEYNGGSLNGMFAQRRNLMRPSFWRMIQTILRFNREARTILALPGDGPTLRDFLTANRYGPQFIEQYLVPMAAAIWSTSPEQMWDFPAKYLVQFFEHHGLLDIKNRPQWYTIPGGSHTYVKALTAPFRDRIRLATPIASVRRLPNGVLVTPRDAAGEMFDHVVLATHSDQALRLLADPSPDEQRILGAMPYQPNEAVLHTDARLLPRRRRAWASWNYHLADDATHVARVTYDLTRLQRLPTTTRYLVTLNHTKAIAPETILRTIRYHHPLYTHAAVAAQREWQTINGVNRTSYCGAYWSYGFHEDGVKSGLAVCRALGELASRPA